MTATAPKAEAAPLNFYRPNNNVLTPEMRSPQWVQMSTAAAITLGIMPGWMHRTDCTHCLNLLLTYPEGCRANCAYCGLARHRDEERNYADRNFIRVDWPSAPLDDVIQTIKEGKDGGKVERMCISMITHPRSEEDTLAILKKWRAELPEIPTSILSNPTTMNRADLVALKEAGADIFTVALDGASEAVFEATRGKGVQGPHTWSKYWEVLGMAREIFGRERIGAHIIIGMGESEQEALETIQKVRDMGGHSHLFAFFPEEGSLMDDRPAVDRAQYRRVQLGRYLIDFDHARIEQFSFDADGVVTDYGLSAEDYDYFVNQGRAFQTSGCPGKSHDVSACNRPYGDSPVSDIASFPFALNAEDVLIAKAQLEGKPVPERAED
ncbi:MAG: radical SAM protein [Alphaproteobacteria bacterium CG_4_10_14_0_2_um_filter_63_37]|nr:MAG: radical SAM protein [Proteobacteria bacterium CG1_02_64_396]PJA24081.1 MAG: radical SAM protein [Alphaproteobacteria bacterium CG_4_10_14_0_2_um_filter_63_37]